WCILPEKCQNTFSIATSRKVSVHGSKRPVFQGFFHDTPMSLGGFLASDTMSGRENPRVRPVNAYPERCRHRAFPELARTVRKTGVARNTRNQRGRAKAVFQAFEVQPHRGPVRFPHVAGRFGILGKVPDGPDPGSQEGLQGDVLLPRHGRWPSSRKRSPSRRYRVCSAEGKSPLMGDVPKGLLRTSSNLSLPISQATEPKPD